MEGNTPMLPIGSFVALGGSFSEGDPYPDGGCRGWADRFAEHVAEASPGLRYANLAIRGKLLSQVLADQLPAALELGPELVSIAAGGNDLLSARADAAGLAGVFDQAVAALRGAGCEVLMFTGFDPGTFPLLRLVRGKVAAFNAELRLIAERRGCLLVDLWTMSVLDPPEWCEDRLHLAPDAHRRVAMRACEVLGVLVTEDWRAPLPPIRSAERPGWLAARRQDASWARTLCRPLVAATVARHIQRRRHDRQAARPDAV
jgi:lysophospholipase L1-like esterase